MKFLYLNIFSLLLLCASSVAAQANQTAILYEVTGNKLAKPSYLLGTSHAICPDDMLPTDKLLAYVDRTDQMVLELDLDDPAVMQSMAGSLMMSGGKTLKDLYTPEQYGRIDELVKTTIGIPLDNLKTFKPTMLSVMLLTNAKLLGCSATAVDTLVMKSAVDKKKTVTGLESVASQIKVLDSMPLEKQAEALHAMALDPQKYVGQHRLLMAAYKAQDSDKLYSILSEQMKGDQDFQAKLLETRNRAWIPQLEALMKQSPAFIAVGAGHLGGKAGVIRLLREKKYKVTPVRL